MNVNFGLFAPLTEAPRTDHGRKLRGPEKARANKRAMSIRAAADFDRWMRDARHLADFEPESAAADEPFSAV